MSESEIRGPGDALSADEETVLCILAQGECMAPIGRWEAPLLSLTERGLAMKLDQFNYVATPRGKVISNGKENDFVRGWIADSNAAAARRAIGRSTDEVDDPREQKPPSRFSYGDIEILSRAIGREFGCSRDESLRLAALWLEEMGTR